MADAVNPIEDKQLAVFICYVADTKNGLQRKPIKKAPWDVRIRAAKIAGRCQEAVEKRLKRALKLLLGEMPSMAQARQYLVKHFDQTTGKIHFTWNGVKILDVYPIEVEKRGGGKIRVSQFVWCPLEKTGRKAAGVKEVAKV